MAALKCQETPSELDLSSMSAWDTLLLRAKLIGVGSETPSLLHGLLSDLELILEEASRLVERGMRPADPKESGHGPHMLEISSSLSVALRLNSGMWVPTGSDEGKLFPVKEFLCSVCHTAAFASSRAVKIHENSCGVKKPALKKSFHCDKCDTDFASKRWLIKHKDRCHGVKTKAPQWRRHPDGLIHCTVPGCGHNQGFPAMYGLRAHFYAQHVSEADKLFVCDHCPRRFWTKSIRNEHERIKHLKLHECQSCGRRFGEKDKLRAHALTHTGEKPFACDECGYRAAKKYNLDVHKRLRHGDDQMKDKSFCCDICGKAFKTRANLSGHITLQHSEEKKADDEQLMEEEVQQEFFESYIPVSEPIAHLLTTQPVLNPTVDGILLPAAVAEDVNQCLLIPQVNH